MTTLNSSYLDNNRSNRTWVALVLVSLLHAGLFWALQNGLAQKTFTAVKKTVEAKLIEEIKPKVEQAPPPIPTPTPPPPKIEKVLPPPLPKSVVPVPEVKPTPTLAPAITAAPEPPAPQAPVAPAVAAPTAASAALPAAPVSAAPAPVAAATAKTGVKTGAKDVSGSCEPPDYPNISRRNEEEGTVVVAFQIAEDGRVISSKIKSSSGFSRLDEAARSAFSKCKFRPATSDGQAVQGEAAVAYRFRLD